MGNCSRERIHVAILSLLVRHFCPVTIHRQLTDESADGADRTDGCECSTNKGTAC